MKLEGNNNEGVPLQADLQWMSVGEIE